MKKIKHIKEKFTVKHPQVKFESELSYENIKDRISKLSKKIKSV